MYILTFDRSSPEQFVEFWKPLYKDPREKLYKDNIGGDLDRLDVVMELFAWKKGFKKWNTISQKQQDSIRRNYINDETVYPEVPDNEFLKDFLYKHGGAIWRIFWLHCNYPDIYPIYDQHVYRAMTYLEKGVITEISGNNKKKVVSYLDEYLSFFKQFQGKGFSVKQIDEALFAFGKFLKSPYGKLVAQRYLE